MSGRPRLSVRGRAGQVHGSSPECFVRRFRSAVGLTRDDVFFFGPRCRLRLGFRTLLRPGGASGPQRPFDQIPKHGGFVRFLQKKPDADLSRTFCAPLLRVSRTLAQEGKGNPPDISGGEPPVRNSAGRGRGRDEQRPDVPGLPCHGLEYCIAIQCIRLDAVSMRVVVP